MSARGSLHQQVEGVEVIETPVYLGVLLVWTVTPRPLLPAELRYTHLHTPSLHAAVELVLTLL